MYAIRSYYDLAERRPLTVSAGIRALIGHPAYRSLAGCYILARIAVDLVGAMFIFYFADWLGREGDFEITMFLFLSLVVLCLPVWLRIARHHDKRTIFIFGAAWWIVAQFFMLLSDPSWARWTT